MKQERKKERKKKGGLCCERETFLLFPVCCAGNLNLNLRQEVESNPDLLLWCDRCNTLKLDVQD